MNDLLERIYKDANGGSDKISTAAIFKAMNAAMVFEREACAEACAALRAEWARMSATDGRYDMMEDAAAVCEDEIRERSNARA